VWANFGLGADLTTTFAALFERHGRSKFSSKEIAHTLNLSPRTVGVYRSNLLHKLGARNAADLVRKSLSLDE
jgi:DNA-binding CsgD family transcriptional regulator